MAIKKIIRKTVYECENCKSEYITEKEADDCCTKKAKTCGDPVVELY